MSVYRSICPALCHAIVVVQFVLAASGASAQSVGAAGTLQGVVIDPSGGAVPRAMVELHNELTGYFQRTTTGDRGEFSFLNIPPNVYHVVVTAASFDVRSQDVAIRSNVPVKVRIELSVGGVAETVEVKAPALMEDVAVSHVDVNQSVFTKLPTMSVASGLSDIVTLVTPAVVGDSNGFFHPLGDHAQMQLSIDNQPITDQQGTIFSTQLPPGAVESMEIIYGITPAEFGDKTSLVINTITRSGLGRAPHGTLSMGYGTFATSQPSATFGLGTATVGNFTALSMSRSDRFLDTPELMPLHAEGQNYNLFDRLDFKPTAADAIHLNVLFGRSTFQIPNDYSQQAAGQDQRQRVQSYDIAPGWAHVVNGSTLLTVNPYYRHDRINYDPSASPFADQPATMSQLRTLTNVGVKADLAHSTGRHNIKAGVQISQTNLMEDFTLGLTDPTFNPVCLTSSGDAVTDPTLIDPAACVPAGYAVNPSLAPGLVPYDLTRGGSLFRFHDSAAIKQQAAFVQDEIRLADWTFDLGLRFDRYDGLSYKTLWQPRAGVTYRVKPTSSIVRFGYARSLQTPLNENLLVSSATGEGGLASNVFGASYSVPLHAGVRDQLNAGLQQALGRRFVLDADYFWKRTENAGCDLDSLFNTAIYFPIEYAESRMNGFSVRLSMLETRGFTAFANVGHTTAKVYTPEVGGLIFNAPLPGVEGLLDHDQKAQVTIHAQYQLPARLPWVSMTWRYDSGVVAGAVPDLDSLLALTPNQQQTVGFFCGSQVATIGSPITSCASSNYGTRFVNVPAAGTENDITNPPRIKPHAVLDLGVGTDDLFRSGKRTRWTARLTVLNVTNKQAMYNFLSTCAGTHFIPTRSVRAEVGVAF
jgi:hypothetical protein